LRGRFWVELSLGVMSGAAFVLTILWHDWIERVSPLDPDRGDGSLEYMLLAGLLTITITTALLARREWAQTRLSVPRT